MLDLASGDASLRSLADVPWLPGTSNLVEFFDGKHVRVTLISTENDDLNKHLEEIIDGAPISVDFEWKPDRNGEFHPISTFQLTTSKGVLVVLNDSAEFSIAIRDFLLSNQCFGKGMTCDNIKLQRMFGEVFQFEDIEVSKLIPHDLPVSFSGLVELLVGKPQASFKDKNVSCSDWSARPLSVQQVVYAAFDVYAMHVCYIEMQKLFEEFTFVVTPAVARRTRGLASKSKPAKQLSPVSGRRAFHLKMKVSVAHIDKSEMMLLMKHPALGLSEFMRHEEYTTKWSLFYRFKALRRIDGDFRCLDCNLRFPDRNELLTHLWSQHFDEVPLMGYLRQAPSFIHQVLGQVMIAKDNIVRSTLQDPVTCRACGAVFPRFRGLYTHCRIRHLDLSVVPERIDLKQLLHDILVAIHEVDDVTEENEVGTCHLCGATFADNTAIVEHCWYEHADSIISMWTHRPSCYPDELYKECFDIGVKVIQAVAGAEEIDGSYACVFCGTGSDDPGELFLHMFHRHSTISTVSCREIDIYPLKICDLPVMLQDVIRRTNFDGIQQSLEISGVFDVFPSVVRCNECLEVFNDENDE